VSFFFKASITNGTLVPELDPAERHNPSLPHQFVESPDLTEERTEREGKATWN
jgi:hypothetical protein